MEQFKNYIKLRGNTSIVGGFKLPWQVEYVYMDTSEYFGDQILVNHGIKHAKFRDMASDEFPNEVIVFIRFSKIYENKFLLVMNELTKKCLILGFKDYKERCNKVFKELTQK